MGTVYEATQLSLRRVVALKVLAGHLSDDVSFTERFRREGQIQAGIDHPHIVTVYDSGQSEHGVFIAMRLVRGPNLKDLIVSRELDAGRALRLLTPSFLDDCEAAATTMELTGAEALELPADDYVSGLNRVIRRLNEARRTGARDLRLAAGGEGQAEAARATRRATTQPASGCGAANPG